MTISGNAIYNFTKIYTLGHLSMNNHIRVSLELVVLREVHCPLLQILVELLALMIKKKILVGNFGGSN